MKYLVHDYFEETVRRLPDKTAFLDPDGSVTFSGLYAGARRTASALLSYAAPRQTIAFYTDKSVSCMVGFMGAMYAGCAYSLLNLRHPMARIEQILSVLHPPVIVTDEAHREAIAAVAGDTPVLLLSELAAHGIDEAALLRVRRQMIDADPLYVNFTSGSTGMPKGVVIGHRSVVDFIRCFTEIFSITESDVIANQAPFDFDVSVKDIFSGLFTGATVAIIPTSYFSIPTKLMDYLVDSRATVLIWAVSALCFLTTMNALAYKCPDTLRTIMFSGEVMPIKHLLKLQKYLPNVTYVNLYGPTEITCNCMYYIVDRPYEVGETLPLGVPFPNERILLLDENDREVTQPGGVGEICVSGAALALGYFADEARTAAAFVQNPLNPAYKEPVYRTGDLAKIAGDGQLVYVSRKDFQIKHMGHRIELGEIEGALSAVAGVDRALCIYQHDKGKILAFITGTADKAQIVDALKITLPAYMIPNVFVPVEAMPLTKNGKIDRAALMDGYLAKKEKARG